MQTATQRAVQAAFWIHATNSSDARCQQHIAAKKHPQQHRKTAICPAPPHAQPGMPPHTLRRRDMLLAGGRTCCTMLFVTCPTSQVLSCAVLRCRDHVPMLPPDHGFDTCSTSCPGQHCLVSSRGHLVPALLCQQHEEFHGETDVRHCPHVGCLPPVAEMPSCGSDKGNRSRVWTLLM